MNKDIQYSDLQDGLYGPFVNPDDIDKYWYQVEEKEREHNLEIAKADLKDMIESKLPIELCKQAVKEAEEELKNLRKFVDNYTRCKERYKYDNSVLKQIERDWADYNGSLWLDYNSTQMYKHGLSRYSKGSEELKLMQREGRSRVIKRQEIERRFELRLKA